MNKDRIIKLLNSRLEDDRLLGLELSSKLSISNIREIFDVQAKVKDWYKPQNQEELDYNTKTASKGKGWKCDEGYLAYNGFTWYTNDFQSFRNSGYKLEENE